MKRREIERAATEAAALSVALHEAKIGADWAVPNIGSVAPLEDVENDGGVKAVRAVARDNARAGPQPVRILVFCTSGGAHAIAG